MEQTRKQRKIYRWIFLAILILTPVILSLAGIGFSEVIKPHIGAAPEKITSAPLFTLPVIGEFYLTQTLLALMIVFILIIWLAWSIKRQVASGKNVLTGVPGVVAALLEGLYGMTEATAGKHARRIFPWFATIFLVVLVANWMELIPGVESIGIYHHPEHAGEGYSTKVIIPGVLSYIVKPDEAAVAEAEHATEGEHTEGGLVELVPFLRVVSSDLNFTIALALISVFMTQVIGVQTQGMRYFGKFWNTKSLMVSSAKKGFGNPLDFFVGVIDFAVGILEIIAEFAKIISFSFRLFGNIFAGGVLLIVIGSLVPVFAQSIFGLLELFVGAIQAFVFGMLTMVFMSGATQGHGGHEEHHEAEHAPAH